VSVAGGPGVRSAIKRASREDDTAVHPTGAMVPPTAKKSAPSATAEQLVDNHVSSFRCDCLLRLLVRVSFCWSHCLSVCRDR